MVIRVLVADDDPVVRSGLRSILASDQQVQVVAEVADGRGAVRAADLHRPDVVLLDVRMPGTDGLAAAEEIRAQHPGQRLVLLTTFGEEAYVRRAVALGVDGFLLKSGDPLELLRGLHAVVAGGACLSPAVAAMVLREARASPRGRAEAETARAALVGLRDREREAVELVAQGRSNAEIARALHLSEATVKSYLGNAFARLGVRNRVEAAVLAWRAGRG